MAFEKPIERAFRWDVLVQQGSTLERGLEFVGADLTGLEFRGQVRRTHADAEVLASFALSVTAPNVLNVGLTEAQTAALPAGKLVHDIEAYVTLTGYVARVLEGRVTVTPEVTRG